MPRLTIGKLAKAANVSIDTIRFYEKSGLLPQPARRPSGFREYSELDLLQLKFVRRARAVGFSIEEIVELLALADEASSAAINSVIERKLAVIDRKINDLQWWRRALRAFPSAPEQTPSKRAFLDYFTAGHAADEESDAPATFQPII